MGKTVLITGTSSGIGAATAKYFLEKGWNVSATRRSRPHTEDWLKGERIICPYLDLTQPDSIQMTLQETFSYFGRVDVLVNNAGYALMGPLEGLTLEQLQQQFQTNVFGLVSMIQGVLPLMRKQGGGTIVNVASIGGRLAFPLASAYHATKWAIEGLSEALRYELDPFNIRLKIIEPGGIRTDFIQRGSVWAKHPAYLGAIEQMQQFSAQLNERLPGPAGVAKAIYRAATDSSSRLRYSPHGEVFLLMHALLPDWLWRILVTCLTRTRVG